MRTEPETRHAEALLAEYGFRPRLIVYLAAAPGAGKTRRLLEFTRRARAAGRDAVIGWAELKGRTDLEHLAEGLPVIPPRHVTISGNDYTDFDLNAALERKPTVIALDEIAHETLEGSPYRYRWQEARALKDAGITVVCAFNIAHLESVAAAAERLTGRPLRTHVPDEFLAAADEVVALDVSPELLRARLRSGKVVQSEDVDSALAGVFSERALQGLRELMMHAVDQLTAPNVSAERVSTAVAFLDPKNSTPAYVERAAGFARALDLRLELLPAQPFDLSPFEEIAQRAGAELLHVPLDPSHIDLKSLRASLVVMPKSRAALNFVNRYVDRDVLIMDPSQSFLKDVAVSPAQDRSRYGQLTVYLGAVAGCGKTYAMLDRAQQLRADGVDVVIGFVETHGRAETAAMIDDLEVLPRRVISKEGIRYEELDREAVLRRMPKVALIDELAHTNAPGLSSRKRYEDVLAILRAGIDVITTLNVQHLEALNDTVYRLTSTRVRETLPDGILAIADEVILIDVTPQTLRERLREGKIYPPERIESALSRFFTVENLTALRELALRETIRARARDRDRAPFGRLLLCAGPRTEDTALIRRCSQIGARLGIEFAVALILEPKDALSPELHAALRDEARRQNATWHEETTPDPPRRIIELARERPETMVACATTLRHPHWPQRNAFARRVLDAGALELLVLTRR
jgi:two-component system, OmpR family, sensor histidine kinase KdpD